MTRGAAVLVVGGDSTVGAGTVKALRQRGVRVYETTRRKDTLGPQRIYLDFEAPTQFSAPSDASYAFVIAAATNYDRCEKDPQARVINEELIPRTVAGLLEQGLFVTFISTNSVFGGERPWPNEDAEHAPGIAYAWQKSRGEAAIRKTAEQLGAASRLNITRLTKIMSAGVSPLPAWFEAWRKGAPVEPFADLVFAPMSVSFVGRSLATLAEKRISGSLHLSGAENISYVDLAQGLARRLGVSAELIKPTTATARGINIPFKPKYSGIGMARTKELTGLEPQAPDRLYDDLVADLGQ